MTKLTTQAGRALLFDLHEYVAPFHGWLPERIAAIEAEAAEAADNPEYDGTDAAHPAWWRGSDHTAKIMRTERDAAVASLKAAQAVIEAARDHMTVPDDVAWQDRLRAALAAYDEADK